MIVNAHNESDPRSQRGLGHWVEAESPVGLLGEDANTGQGAEDPVQRPGRHARGDREFLGPRAIRQPVGDPELSCNLIRLAVKSSRQLYRHTFMIFNHECYMIVPEIETVGDQ